MAEEEETKPNTRSKKDNFDDDFEKVESIFPPIYYPESKGSVLIFQLLGVKVGPKGDLFTCKLLKNDGGTFRRNDEEVNVMSEEFEIDGFKETGIFALGVTPTLRGEDKLADKDSAQLTSLGQACVDTESPVKLVYQGKKKSTQNKSHSYHIFDLYVTKKARAAAR